MSHRNRLFCLTLVTTELLLATTASTSGAQRVYRDQNDPVSADQVIAANIAARGGLARLQRVRSEKLRGHISLSGTPYPLSVDLERPNRVRTEITMNGGRIVQAYDGKVGWTINTTSNAADTMPHVLPAGEAENVAAGGDIDGPLVGYAARGNRVTLAGIDTADGRPAFKLNVVTASGLADTYYIDTTSHLQTKWEGHRTMGGSPVVFESYFRDYRSIDGVMIAFTIMSGTRGESGGQRITFDSVDIDTPMPDSEFTMPTPILR